MKKYKIIISNKQLENYEINAELEEACVEALSGNIIPKIEPCDVEILSTKEINE